MRTISRNNSIRLAARSVAWFDIPVMLPPGRAKLVTKPEPIGSPANGKTIGIADVACFAASAGAVPVAIMTSTLRRTNSAAISANRALRPSAQRYSIAMVRPSIQPRSCKRWTRAATRWLSAEGVAPPKTPMVGNLPACCAFAASGHTAAEPPSSVMNWRRADHSITSSARPISGNGIVTPSVFAVLRLTSNSILVTCCTGRSAGFSPLNIRLQ